MMDNKDMEEAVRFYEVQMRHPELIVYYPSGTDLGAVAEIARLRKQVREMKEARE
jgi:hypothetical protein